MPSRRPLSPLSSRTGSLAAAAFGLASLTAFGPAHAQNGAAAVPEVLVGLTPAAPAATPGTLMSVRRQSPSGAAPAEVARLQQAKTRLEATVGTVTGQVGGLGVLRVKLRPGQNLAAALAAARSVAGVAYAEPNHVMKAFATPSDQHFAANQWGPKKVGMEQAWPLWNPKASTVVAIIDTGVAVGHPDLANKLLRDGNGNVVGYDFVNNDADANDDNNHGTHCAGIAAGEINNGQGVAGIAGWNGASGSDTVNTRIMPVKVLAHDGNGYTSSVANGIIWAADRGAKVISLSLGSPYASTTLQNAVTYAFNKGCVIVAAAGNEATSQKAYPGACTNVISVAATDGNDTLANFSNYGSWVTVAAPGVSIVSTITNNGYAWFSGTSMATPLVAGQIALMASQAPTLTNTQLRDAVVANTDPVAPSSGRTIAGGRVNVYRALNAVTTVPTGTAAAASFVRQDSITRGNWVGAYGRDGYQVVGAGGVNPSYGTVTPSYHSSWVWANSTSDARALLKPAGTDRIAGCWHSGSAFDVRVNATDGAQGNTHNVALYLLDWDNYGGGRSVRIEVWDTARQTKLTEQNVSNFQNGAYAVFNVRGDVTFRIVNTNGASNAVLSGVFLDPASSGGTTNAAASFAGTDTLTRGTWTGQYGTDGYTLIGSSASNPSYATVTPSNNGAWTWAGSTLDTRALLKANSTDRIASCWYSGGSFDVAVNVSDSSSHRVSLYLLDWDSYGGGRSVRIEAWDTARNVKLAEQNVSNFQNGTYVKWNVQGSVTFKVVNTNGASNAVLSGVFFDPAS